MVHPGSRPAGGGMAVVANIGTGNMRCTLTGGCRPVMTGITCSRHRRMVHPGPGPVACCMTIFTGIGTGNVGYAFAEGLTAVMAGDAGPGYCAVVHSGRNPVACCSMAVIAGIGADYMVLILAWERNAIMTSRTFSDC